MGLRLTDQSWNSQYLHVEEGTREGLLSSIQGNLTPVNTACKEIKLNPNLMNLKRFGIVDLDIFVMTNVGDFSEFS